MSLTAQFDAQAQAAPMTEAAQQLFAAVAAGDLALVKSLLDAGAPADSRDLDGNTPLMKAAEQDDKLFIASTLLGYGADVAAANKAGRTALTGAVDRNSTDITDLLLGWGADPLVIPDPAIRQRLIFRCVLGGNEQAVDGLLATGIKPDSMTSQNETMLLLAAQAGEEALVRKFLNLGISVHACDADGRSPLRAAMQGRHLGAVKILLAAGADPACELTQKDANKTRVSDREYAEKTCGGEIEALVKAADQKFEINRHAGWSGGLQTVQDALAAGEPADTIDRLGSTGLMNACCNGKTQAPVVKALLDAGADPNRAVKNNRGVPECRPLNEAAKAGAAECIEALIGAGAQADARDGGGNTALMDAVVKGSAEAVEALLKGGAKPDVTDKAGVTPLFQACVAGRDDIAGLLLKAGANPNISCPPGVSPLHAAVSKGSAPCVELLCAAHASTYAKDPGHLTPLDVARSLKNDDVLKLIEERRDFEINQFAENSIRLDAQTTTLKTLKFKPKAMG